MHTKARRDLDGVPRLHSRGSGSVDPDRAFAATQRSMPISPGVFRTRSRRGAASLYRGIPVSAIRRRWTSAHVWALGAHFGRGPPKRARRPARLVRDETEGVEDGEASRLYEPAAKLSLHVDMAPDSFGLIVRAPRRSGGRRQAIRLWSCVVKEIRARRAGICCRSRNAVSLHRRRRGSLGQPDHALQTSPSYRSANGRV